MPVSSYGHSGLLRAGSVAPDSVRDLQRDLRAIGYLRRGIDGQFGAETERAVRALQYDLLHATGRGPDGEAPVRVCDYNRGRVTAVTGVVDAALAECIAGMMADARFPKLPASPDPAADNARAAAAIEALPPAGVPTPWLVAVLRQEGGLLHFALPRAPDEDRFLVVRTHTGGPSPDAITARAYGAGRHSLLHHPPRADEVRDLMLDPVRNVARAAASLREKLESFVSGPVDRAEDRIAERGDGPPTRCKYAPRDRRYLRDCATCAAAAGARDIRPGLPLYPGSRSAWQPTMHFPSATYLRVPARERIGCDWPYAARRFSGGGINSFHSQARVLLHLARSAAEAPAVPLPQ